MSEPLVDVGRNMAVETTAVQLLAQLKDELAFEGQTKDGVEAELPAKVLAEHAVNTRKTHKWLYSQLQVMKFLLDFLDSAPCVQDASESAVRKEMAEAKQQWKALKTEYQQQVEAIEGAVPQALAKLEKARNQAQLLEEALQRYQTKKQEMDEKVRSAQDRHRKEQELLCERQRQVEGLVAELQDRLQVQHEELQQLQRELKEQDRQACHWQEKFREISDFQHLLEMLQGVKLIYASENDLELELISHSQPVTPNPHCLKLRLHWGDDGNVTLQSDNPLFLVSAVLPMGTCSTIKDVVLELQHNYSQQAQLLAEIESLQSCLDPPPRVHSDLRNKIAGADLRRPMGQQRLALGFAIDWQQENRLLRYLKPSSTCSLYVEPGYPANGGILLLSVKSQHGIVDVTAYKPPQEMPSMQDWLEYLSTVDFNAPFLS